MSYRIVYGGSTPAQYPPTRSKKHLQLMTAVFVMLFALAVGQFWPRGREVLRNFLLPGEPTVTEQAFSELVSDLSQGIKLEEAMGAFCQQIIDHGAGESD